jgi:hypothetical protein
MSFALALPVAEASLFTLGCLLIHGLRRHADLVTGALACLLALLTLLLALAGTPEPVLRAQAAALENGEALQFLN